MNNEKKAERNIELMQKRDRNPKRWSFSELGKFYGIKTSTAFEIYHREKARKSINRGRNPVIPASVAGKYLFITGALDPKPTTA